LTARTSFIRFGGPAAVLNSASPMAKIATASVVTSIPSRSCSTPKASRAWPVCPSMPTIASASPMNSEIRPLQGLSPKAADTVTKGEHHQREIFARPKDKREFDHDAAR
jgi:hypothetical protein